MLKLAVYKVTARLWKVNCCFGLTEEQKLTPQPYGFCTKEFLKK